MKNPYNYIDDKILAGVNSLVSAYNWTTGGTKANLANKIVTASTISGCLGAIELSYNHPDFEHYLFSSFMLLTYLAQGHLSQRSNKNQERLEEQTKEDDGYLSLEVEEIKERRKIHSILWGVSGVGLTPASFICEEHAPFILGFMYGYALENYIMRAENLPPRKNVFSRAKDKIKKYFEQKAKSPSGLPTPEPAFNFSLKKELSDYL